MLHIAICDDQTQELADIAAYTKEYLEINQTNVEIRQFNHPDELLNFCESRHFHIYILDIVMPMINGVEVGRDIRRLDREAQIIYATSEPGFALEAYAANPLSYLIKPINKSQLYDSLELAISKVNIAKETTVTLKTQDGLRVLTLSSIVCCEYAGRCAVYTLVGGDIVTTRTLQHSFAEQMGPLLKDKRFLQPHKSFALNMNFVTGFSKDGFTLRGDVRVPISTKHYGAVRDAYMDYLMEKGGAQ